MKRKDFPFLILGACVAGVSAAHAQPTDNPVTRFYPGLDQYQWTDALRWEQVTITAAVADDGADDLAVVQAEIEALSAAGGGVLYFPAGTYDFSDDLLVWDSVILRGVQPGDGFVSDNLDPERDPAAPADEVDNAKSQQFALETKFEFPKFVFDPEANGGAGNDRRAAFKAIRLNDPYRDSNVGICWIDINRARIEWVEYGEDEAGMAASYWGYFGVNWNPALPFTDESNRWREIKARNWVVFGNRINNAARWDNRPNVAPPVGKQPAWTIWPKRISAQIDTFNYENNLVANNRLMDRHLYEWDNSQPNGSQPGPGIDDFLMPGYTDKNGTVIGDVWFAYTSGHGIKMNRSIGLDGNQIPYTPERFPMLYRRGVVCRDNWSFVTRRVGYYVGGDGVECIGNYRIDVSYPDPRKIALVNANGDQKVRGAPTFENRGYDVTGTNAIFTHNYWDVFRTRAEGPYYSTDGEGFLHQEVGGGTPVDGWVIENNDGNAYIGIYKSREIRRTRIVDNLIRTVPVPGPSTIFCVADTNGGPFPMEDVLIEGNISSGGIAVKASAGVSNVTVRDNDGSGSVRLTQGITAENNGALSGPSFYSGEGEIPPSPYDPLADGRIVAPLDGNVVAPGAQITFDIEAADAPAAPTVVAIWLDLVKQGEAVPASEPGTYTLDVVAPTEPGLYYYFLEVQGSPHTYWSAPLVVRVAEPEPYQPLGWRETAFGMVEDAGAPWFFDAASGAWLWMPDLLTQAEIPETGLWFFDAASARWCWVSAATGRIVWVAGESGGWFTF